jgi:membrane dipeptidase
MTRHVADLHCDLLSYLQVDTIRNPYQDEAHCSVAQMHAGQVRFQTLAIYTDTDSGSSRVGLEQAEIFKLLPAQYPSDFQIIQSPQQLPDLLAVGRSRIGVVAAIENASSFCEEEGSFEAGLENLRTMFGKVGRPLYISLTWNSENRFGGGADTAIGLKEDGRHLLDFLHDKQIAVDLSHASDALAEEILAYIDDKMLRIQVLASHSNVRTVTQVARNLPEEIVREIAKRKGVIGLNFVKHFVGEEPKTGFVRQLEALLSLTGEDVVCFGADFFFDEDFNHKPRPPDGWYFQNFGDASCYGRLLELWKAELGIADDLLAKIAYRNLFGFVTRLWGEAQLHAMREFEEKAVGRVL